jgi:hypothetical protein
MRGAQFTERGVVLLDDAIQQRRFRSVPDVARRIDERRRTRSPRIGAGEHRARPWHIGTDDVAPRRSASGPEIPRASIGNQRHAGRAKAERMQNGTSASLRRN